MPKIPKLVLTDEQRAIVEQVREAAERDRPQIIEEQRRLQTAHEVSGIQLRRAFELLRAVRHERGITIAAVSKASGISAPGLSRLENTPGLNVTLTTLTRVANALDCDLRISIVPRAKTPAKPVKAKPAAKSKRPLRA